MKMKMMLWYTLCGAPPSISCFHQVSLFLDQFDSFDYGFVTCLTNVVGFPQASLLFLTKYTGLLWFRWPLTNVVGPPQVSLLFCKIDLFD